MKRENFASAFITGVFCCATLVVITGTGIKTEAPFEAPYGQQWQIPSMPSTMAFAGEEVPLHRWVKEFLEKEILYNYYNPAHMLYILRLSQEHFPFIEAQLAANNIPADFKYLCVTESNLQNLISKAGATGYWQFMKTTAPAYGLSVNSEVDERYHLQKSTDAACKYLRSAYKRFGSWTAAAASYNCGMGGYAQRASFQQTNNYYELHLPEETQRYIFRVLAFKYIMQNADSLGFKLPVSENTVKTKSILVSKSIPNLSQFAKANGTDLKVLKFLNPWIKGYSLTIKAGRSYQLILPN